MKGENTLGISLLEVLIVIAILGILAAVAYPSYMQYIIKARRADAIVGLAQIQSQYEQYYSINNVYPNSMQARPISPYYRFSAGPGNTGDPKTSYLISAFPIGTQTDDTDCVIFTLDSTNTQTSFKKGGQPNPACWGH